MPEILKRPLKVFLCHASQDKVIVRELSQWLNAEGWIDAWLDEKKLLPGQDWRSNIEEAVETSDNVIICLSSNSVSKEGYVQKELRYAREISLEKPDNTIFLIPLRLDDCTVPRGLRFFQWADYFGEKKEETYDALLQSLKLRYEQKLKIEEEEQARQEKAKREREKIEFEVSENTARQMAERDTAGKAARQNVKHEASEMTEREKTKRDVVNRATNEKSKHGIKEKAESKKISQLGVPNNPPNLLVWGGAGIGGLIIGGMLFIAFIIFLVIGSNKLSNASPHSSSLSTPTIASPTLVFESLKTTTPLPVIVSRFTEIPTDTPPSTPTETEIATVTPTLLSEQYKAIISSNYSVEYGRAPLNVSLVATLKSSDGTDLCQNPYNPKCSYHWIIFKNGKDIQIYYDSFFSYTFDAGDYVVWVKACLNNICSTDTASVRAY